MNETANALAEPDQAGNWESARACQDQGAERQGSFISTAPLGHQAIPRA